MGTVDGLSKGSIKSHLQKYRCRQLKIERQREAGITEHAKPTKQQQQMYQKHRQQQQQQQQQLGGGNWYEAARESPAAAVKHASPISKRRTPAGKSPAGRSPSASAHPGSVNSRSPSTSKRRSVVVAESVPPHAVMVPQQQQQQPLAGSETGSLCGEIGGAALGGGLGGGLCDILVDGLSLPPLKGIDGAAELTPRAADAGELTPRAPLSHVQLEEHEESCFDAHMELGDDEMLHGATDGVIERPDGRASLDWEAEGWGVTAADEFESA